MVRLVDSTGQVLQYELSFTSPNWQNVQIPLIGGATSQFFDGANDGVAHPPITSIDIGPMLSNYMGAIDDSSGVMCISDLCAYNGNEAVNIDLSSDKGAATYRAAGSENFNSSTSYPPNSLVTPLKMTVCRGAMNCFTGQGMFPAAARLTSLGMRIQVMLNGNFTGNTSCPGDPYSPGFPGDVGSSGVADWTDWDNYVSSALTTALTT